MLYVYMYEQILTLDVKQRCRRSMYRWLLGWVIYFCY